MDTPTEAPAYYPRWILSLEEDLDCTFLGLVKTPVDEAALILREMEENDDLRSAEGDATCLWLYLPEPDSADRQPRMEAFQAGYMERLRKLADQDRVYLVKVEYRVRSTTAEKALAVATHQATCQAAAQAMAAFGMDNDHLAMLDHAEALRAALMDEQPEILRTDVRRPGEAGDW